MTNHEENNDAHELTLSRPQHIFLNELNTKFRAYIGGLGSGKTFVGCLDLLLFANEHTNTVQGYFGPTYPSIRDIFYPTFTEAAQLLGLDVDIQLSNKEVDIYKGDRNIGKIICRSMDNPGSIIGFKIARALCDEIDTLRSDKAAQAWRAIIARLRLKIPGVVNGVACTSTPEGFAFIYEQFVKTKSPLYSMVQASTYENEEFLPEDYIPSLLESYPQNLVNAYIHGHFVNLTHGSVYSNFDRVLNKTRREYKEGEPIYVGMDFNVGKMAAIIHVKDNGEPRAVDEIINAYDTPAMIEIIKSRYPKSTVRVYPDASGGSRKSVNAAVTDIALLEQAGFRVVSNKSNPPVKDRINAFQRMLCNNKNERKYLVNVDKCPTLADNLEQQVWNNQGEPDKTADKDHSNDAAGYFVAYEYPIIKPAHNLKVKFIH